MKEDRNVGSKNREEAAASSWCAPRMLAVVVSALTAQTRLQLPTRCINVSRLEIYSLPRLLCPPRVSLRTKYHQPHPSLGHVVRLLVQATLSPPIGPLRDRDRLSPSPSWTSRSLLTSRRTWRSSLPGRRRRPSPSCQPARCRWRARSPSMCSFRGCTS
jgi:hypothetical protein